MPWALSTDSDTRVRIGQRVGRLPVMSGAQRGAESPEARPTRSPARRIIRRLAAAAVVGVLAACTPAAPSPGPTTASPSASLSGSPTPTPSDEPTEPSAEPTPSDSPTDDDPNDRSELLEQPPEMANDDEAGAIAAAKYYMGLYEYVFLTGDLEMWEQMALPECEFCAVVVEHVTDMHDAGRYRVSGPPKWRGEPTTRRVVTQTMWSVTLQARVSASTTYGSDGTQVDESPAARAEVKMGMIHDGDQWRTLSVTVSDG